MKVIAVIATKNRMNLLEKAIDSVFLQSNKPDFTIVTSDSTDENYLKEQEYLSKFNCWLIRDKYTHNYAGNLNTAIDFIIEKFNPDKETYIAFLDDDDVWDVDYIKTCKDNIGIHDFIVTGLRGINEKGKFDLNIPNKLSVQDFLKGNPGIQGSNTFVRFNNLLKAGCFDENMSSTTDRDLFTRLMIIGSTYTTVNEYLVDVDGYNDRVRITNTPSIKKDGLSKFYFKYHKLMEDETKEQFFKRTQTLFDLDEKQTLEIIKNNKYSEYMKEFSFDDIGKDIKRPKKHIA